jgi:hypothetical protein
MECGMMTVHFNKLGVMRGLDPRIHDAAPRSRTLRKSVLADPFHGLPGQARQ